MASSSTAAAAAAAAVAAVAAVPPASGFLVCEISGQSLLNQNDTIVVTPSGHICLQRFLELKLQENGSVDPFNTTAPLSLDDCIVLQTKNKPSSSSLTTTAALPLSAPHSYIQLLQQLQREYDAVVLELFDTRQVLQSTRKELSQALYQQDAAVRVIARLLQEQEKNGTSDEKDPSHGVAASSSNSNKRARIEETLETNHEMATTNAAATTESNTSPTTMEPSTTTTPTTMAPSTPPIIPTEDLETMTAIQKDRFGARKAMIQQATKVAVTDLTLFSTLKKPPMLSSQNISTITSVMAGKAYDAQFQVLLGTIATSAAANTTTNNTLLPWKLWIWNNLLNVDNEAKPLLVDMPNGMTLDSTAMMSSSSSLLFDVHPPHVIMVAPLAPWLGLYDMTTNTWATTTQLPVSPFHITEPNDKSKSLIIIQVHLHHSTKHVVFTYNTGLVTLHRFEIMDKSTTPTVSLVPLTYWQPFSTTVADTTSKILSTLHPDGMLHAICQSHRASHKSTITSKDDDEAPVIYVYDIQHQQVAITLTFQKEPTTLKNLSSIITAMVFSPNGYHLAMALWQQPSEQQGEANKEEEDDAEAAKIAIWDLRKGKIVASLTLPSSATSSDYPTKSNPIALLTFDASGKSLAYALDNGTVGVTSFKNKTTLNEPVLLVVPSSKKKKTTKKKKSTTTTTSTSRRPSSLLWPLPSRIVVTYQKEDHVGQDDDDDDDEVICVLQAVEATTPAAAAPKGKKRKASS
jgi:pre-mRNA-processing factor 19